MIVFVIETVQPAFNNRRSNRRRDSLRQKLRKYLAEPMCASRNRFAQKTSKR